MSKMLASFALAALVAVGGACYSSSGQAPAPSPAPAPAPAPVAEPAPAAEPTPAASADCVASGCSGTMCVAVGKEMMSTCEYKPVYGCYKNEGARCEKQANGECGWTKSATLDACIAAGGPK